MGNLSYRNLKWAFSASPTVQRDNDATSTLFLISIDTFAGLRRLQSLLLIKYIEHCHHPSGVQPKFGGHGSESTQKLSALGRVGEGRERAWSRCALEKRQIVCGKEADSAV